MFVGILMLSHLLLPWVFEFSVALQFSANEMKKVLEIKKSLSANRAAHLMSNIFNSSSFLPFANFS